MEKGIGIQSHKRLPPIGVNRCVGATNRQVITLFVAASIFGLSLYPVLQPKINKLGDMYDANKQSLQNTRNNMLEGLVWGNNGTVSISPDDRNALCQNYLLGDELQKQLGCSDDILDTSLQTQTLAPAEPDSINYQHSD